MSPRVGHPVIDTYGLFHWFDLIRGNKDYGGDLRVCYRGAAREGVQTHEGVKLFINTTIFIYCRISAGLISHI